jgi:hypothetical protein
MENKDYIDVGATKPIMKFNLKIAEVKKEFNKKFMPYDEPCARLDFVDECERLERESERKYGYVKVDKIDVEPKNLEKYGDPNRFELIEDKEETEFIIVNGIRTSTVAGHTLSYKCKERGHGISVYIPIKEYKEIKEKERSKK